MTAQTTTALDLHVLGQQHVHLAAAVQRACFDEKWSADAIAGILATVGTFGFLASTVASPVGLILCQNTGEDAEVLAFCVIEAGRRRGVGGRLLDAALWHATQMGARRMVLEVAIDNVAARRLYAAVGFTAVGQRRSYYTRSAEDRVDALVLARDLRDFAPSVLPEPQTVDPIR